MIESSPEHDTRRVPGGTGGQTDGNTSRKKLAGSISDPHPPSRVEQALKNFGKRIQALREQAGLSQQRLGNDCGITTAKMKRIETGEADANLFNIIHLADRLGVKLKDLFRSIE